MAPSVLPDASSSKVHARFADQELASPSSRFTAARVEAADVQQQSPDHRLVSENPDSVPSGNDDCVVPESLKIDNSNRTSIPAAE